MAKIGKRTQQTRDGVDRNKLYGLSEAIGIMSRMQEQQHIDAELFALFLRSGVYLDYARRFMQPEQIDRVDIDHCLGGPTVPT